MMSDGAKHRERVAQLQQVAQAVAKFPFVAAIDVSDITVDSEAIGWRISFVVSHDAAGKLPDDAQVALQRLADDTS